MQVEPLVEHLFRHQSGRIVSTLVRILGPRHIDLAEEVTQDALLRALEVWPFRGIPDNPSAWLTQVARNKALDILRRRALHQERTRELIEAWQPPRSGNDEAAMLFLCCHPQLPRDSQVALALKTVCGFSVAEIARAFLADERTIAQRLVRARKKITGFDTPGSLDSVLDTLYLLFNEGYSANSGEDPVRADLCDEAIRLARFVSGPPESCAVLALFLLQSARLPARTDEAGEIVLLEDQNPALWDAARLGEGMRWLNEAARGDRLTAWHLEAGIAAAHCATVTDWPYILSQYDCLMSLKPTPVVALNRAVAVARVHGPDAGLAALPSLDRYHWLSATRARLLEWAGRAAEARTAYACALDAAPTAAERRYLKRRLEGVPA